MPALILLTLGLLAYPGKIKAQENLFNYSINEVSFSVNVNSNLSTNNEIDIDNSGTGLTILTWPLPPNAGGIKVFVDNQEQKYNLISQTNAQFLVFNAGSQNHITYNYAIPPEQKGENWEIFIPIIREPHIYIPDFKFKLTLPEGGQMNQAKIYLVHNLEPGIVSENNQNNIYSAQLKIEPSSIVSFQGETNYQFKISIWGELINIINRNFLILSLAMAIAIILSLVIFLYFYLFGFNSRDIGTPPDSFLEKSYIYFKKITPEAIAATILSWGEKGFINIIEKDDRSFVLGKVKLAPPLPPIEQKLWDYLFQKGNLSLNLTKISERAEETIIPKELIEIENQTIERLEQTGYLKNANRLGVLGINNLILIFSFIILVCLTIASWLANINWLILPGIIFSWAVIILGNNIPTFIALTGKGRQAKSQLSQWKEKLSEQITTNLTFETLSRNLSFMVFFSLEEKIAHASRSLPTGNYTFYVAVNPSELPANIIKNVLDFVFTISRNLNNLQKL